MRNPFARLAAALRRPRLLRFASAALDSAAKTERTADYYADALDEPASRTLDRETREECQARGQMEFLNDSLFYGACQKVAALVVGVGPALKIDGPFSPSAAALYVDATDKTQYLERCFARFADAVDLVSKLRLATLCALYHGEVFLRKTPSVATFEKFDYAFVRPGRVADPGPTLDPLVCDGIRYDRPDDAATPVGYYVLIEGVNPNADASFEYEFVPAGEMIHLFDAIVPQQRRGVPEAQAALDLIRELKLLRRLEIQAVKNAAKTSVIFHTDDPEVLRAARASSVDGDGTIAAPKPGSRSELPDGVLVAPVGYAPTFGDAKHPTTGFDAFKKLIAADVGATLGVGSGKINNDHSSYNFSSAKMDEQNDAIAVAVRQKRLARGFLDVLFNDWLTEFAARDAVAEELLRLAGAPENVARRWLFPEPRAIDRKADAEADEIELRNGTTTLEKIFARRGEDYEDSFRQRARELKRTAESLEASGLGLSTTGALSTTDAAAPSPNKQPIWGEPAVDRRETKPSSRGSAEPERPAAPERSVPNEK
ncbi:MAG: phage portal protein [Thermoguttaceae bacterium]|nr:phage portal protein [Thermoguttaceae bacterium]